MRDTPSKMARRVLAHFFIPSEIQNVTLSVSNEEKVARSSRVAGEYTKTFSTPVEARLAQLEERFLPRSEHPFCLITPPDVRVIKPTQRFSFVQTGCASLMYSCIIPSMLFDDGLIGIYPMATEDRLGDWVVTLSVYPKEAIG